MFAGSFNPIQNDMLVFLKAVGIQMVFPHITYDATIIPQQSFFHRYLSSNRVKFKADAAR